MILCVALVLATVGILSCALTWRTYRESIRDASQYALVFARSLSETAEPAVLLNDAEALDRVVRVASQDDAVSAVEITDCLGSRLAVYHSPRRGISELADVRFRPIEGTIRRDSALIEQFADRLCVVVPIWSEADATDLDPLLDEDDDAEVREDNAVGFVRMCYSLDRARSSLRGSILYTVIISVVVILAGIGVTVVVVRRLLRPVENLVQTTSGIARGDLALRASEDVTGEIGVLARAFNYMAGRLQETYASIEQKVADRTEELEARSRQLQQEVLEREQAESRLKTSMNELERHNTAMMGRERRIVTLKRRINATLKASGQPKAFRDEEERTELGEGMLSEQGTERSDECVPLADVLDELKTLQPLLESFCESVRIAAAIIDLQGEVLVSARWQRICTQFHRQHPETCRKCIKSDTIIANQMREGERFSVYRCQNGLTDAASPIIIDGEHVANLFVGQFLLETPDVDFFAGQAAEFGFPVDDYLEALAEVPVVDQSTLKHILGFLTELANLAGSLGVNLSELSRANATLRDHSGALLSMMEDAVQARDEAERNARQADAATRVKSEFLANMSHEIRTPMTAILGFADVLLENEAVHGAIPDRVEAAETIKRNGEHLVQIINDILDLSKVEAGKMSVEQIPCEPCKLVAEVASLVSVKASSKNIAFIMGYDGAIPETIQTDPTRLRQILINLLGNAIKFTEIGLVRLITRCVEGEDGFLMEFDVVDTGIGMTEEQIARLFQPFTQADTSTTRSFGGTGLGLTISKRFAEMLGGDISVVESRFGVGTRIRVTVAAGPLDGVKMIQNPRSATVIDTGVAATARSAGNTGQPAPQDCRVLLAEDGPDNQRLISFVLKKAGAQVVVKENGKLASDAALAAWRDGRPFDVILMDMQMPVMDGYEAARLLRRSGYAGRIIALTAHAMEGDRAKCIEAGCDDYVTKPIDRNMLLTKIQGRLLPAAAPAAMS